MAKSFNEKDRENKVYLIARDVNIIANQKYNIGKDFAHTSIVMIPDNQDEFFAKDGKLKEKYIKLGYPVAENFGNEKGWIVGGFNGEANKGEMKGKLVVRINDTTDVEVFNKINNRKNTTDLNGEILKEIKLKNISDTELINKIIANSIIYQKNTNYQNYFPVPIHFKGYNEEIGEEFYIRCGYNCNSFSNTILRNVGINNPFERINSQRSIPGKNILVPFEESEK
ncbi:hypothetical protein [Fusobacterium russii]|uniref:hypothetical protein n=1 Tax=Fusobacterium russii TaxID=854 RepID=UPI0003A68C59|nr:hypothetical protein [Fusobacterium russii]